MPEDRSDQPAAPLYERFLATTRDAIDAGLLEAAFHGLAAALHCAENLEDLALVQEIERLADQTQSQIDSEQPNHRIGSKSAAHRGQTALFRTLIVQAQSVAARIRGADAIASAGQKRDRRRSPSRTQTSDTP